MFKKILTVVVLSFSTLFSTTFAEAERLPVLKTLILALDDRPVNIDYPLYLIGDNALDLSEASFENSLDDKLAILKAEIKKTHYDSAIISLDNLLYNGLMESRHVSKRLSSHEQQSIIDFFKFLKAKGVKTHVFTSSQRVATSIYTDSDLESYHIALSANTKLTFSNFQSNVSKEFIPSGEMLEYYGFRANKLSDTTFLVEKVGPLVTSFYVGQDDTQNSGIQKFELHYLKSLTNRQNVHFINGTDELISFLIYKTYSNDNRPKVNLQLTDPENINEILNFEGKDLDNLLKEKAKMFNIDFVDLEDSDYVWIINNSKKEFDKTLLTYLESGKKVIISDLNTSDNSSQIIDDIIRDDLSHLDNIVAYSSWNTASNIIGLSLSQGFLSDLADGNKLLLEKRILKDYLYKTILQNEVKNLFPEVKSNQYNIRNPEINEFLKNEMNIYLENTLKSDTRVKEVILPWNRLFEVTIVFSDI